MNTGQWMTLGRHQIDFGKYNWAATRNCVITEKLRDLSAMSELLVDESQCTADKNIQGES